MKGVKIDSKEEIARIIDAPSDVEARKILRGEGIWPYEISNVLDQHRGDLPPIRLAFGGVVLVIGGLITIVYFFFFYDTSVTTESIPVPGYGTVGENRVYNLGLLQNRLLGCVGGMMAAAIGSMMLIADNLKHVLKVTEKT